MDAQNGMQFLLPIVAAFLGFGLAWLMLRPDRLRASLAVRDADLDQHRQDLAALQARFTAKSDEIERERSATGQRTAAITAERDESRAKAADLQEEKTRIQSELASVSASLKQLQVLTDERDAARRELNAERAAHAQLRADYSTIQAESTEKLKASDEKIELLTKLGQQLKTDFENLANRIFEEKTRTFTQTNKDSVEGLLKPVREQLTDFKSKVEEVYDKEARDRTSLKTEIGLLQKASEKASTGAESLAKALKGDSRLRGHWGEISLERILEGSGLRKGHEYEVQSSHKNEEGERLRPDVIIRLPEQKVVIVDSKVSLVAYARYHGAEGDEDRQNAAKEHLLAVRAHIAGLSGKKYQDIVGLNSLNLVLMFMPIEPAYLLALQQDESLYSDAFRRGILLVSPTTLMGTLQIIHNIWSYERQNRHTVAIASAATKLYDHFVLFTEALEEVGKHLGKAQESFETARKRLATGKGNLLSKVEVLRKLHVKVNKELPAGLLQIAEDDPDEDIENVPALLTGVADSDSSENS